MMKCLFAWFTMFITAFALITIPAVRVSAAQQSHVVREGDNLWKISREYNVSFGDLIDANPQVTALDLIYPGAVLTIPDAAELAKTREAHYAAPAKSTPPAAPATQTDKGVQTNDAAKQPAATTELSVNAGDADGFEQAVVDLINYCRSQLGIPPLTINAEVARVARYKAEDMADSGVFSHQSNIYGTPFEMLTKFKIPYDAAGENIARGYADAHSVVGAWLYSEPHRQNMLNPYFTEVGVGYFSDANKGGKPYWTLMLTSKK